MLTKKDSEGLQVLLEQVAQFQADIFDWVSPLGAQTLLAEIYTFQAEIVKKIEEIEHENDS